MSLLLCFQQKNVNWEGRKKRKEKSKLHCSFPSWPIFLAALLSSVKGLCKQRAFVW